MFSDTPAFSGFSVDDLDAARGFYRDTLGLQVGDNPAGLTLQIAGGRPILVYPKPDHQPATYTILNFPVDDVEAAIDSLASRGVTVKRYPQLDQDERGIMRAGGPLIAWFADPAGNILSVLQER
jgi:catechol 2,3-dioxygenase-like lactoylglutathione lyase family enzyme